LAAAGQRRRRAADPEKTKREKREYYWKNRDKIVEQNKAWRARNPDVMYAAAQRWKKAHPDKEKMYSRAAHVKRKAAKLGTQHPVATLDEILTLEQRCQACGSDAEHLDHIWPLARGGCSALHNLQWLCEHCNCSKGAKTMDEWLGSAAT